MGLNRLRGHSVRAYGPERLFALSDGVYAIAITLLVLTIDVRPGLNDAEFRDALRHTVPQILAYALSFIVIAAFWRDQRRILHPVRHTDGTVTRLTLLGLGLVALMPFPTALLAEYGNHIQAVAIYSGTIAVVAALHLALVVYLFRHPDLSTTPLTKAEYHLAAAYLGSTVLVMLLSVSIALVFGSALVAKWIWLVLLPAKQAAGFLAKRWR